VTLPGTDDLDLAGRRVMIREDLNVPVDDGVVTSNTRIEACVPSLSRLAERGARTLVLSHLGRPTEGTFDPEFSLAPVATRLGELMGRRVRLAGDWLDGVQIGRGEIVLGENVRFNAGEKANDEALARTMAALCDVFVMDAFATAHRAQASTHGVARFAPVARAGPLLIREIEALGRALESPARPLLAIVGGAKVSTKLAVLETLSQSVDTLIVGGGIANTFIAAAGHDVGASLYEPDLVDTARRIMHAIAEGGGELPVPFDVVVTNAPSDTARARVAPASEIAADEMVLDIGPRTTERWCEHIAQAGTIVWNGPAGVFEREQFSAGTRALADAIAASGAYSIAGGGETLAAIDKYALGDGVSYICTGGGAFLEFLEGRKLPAVEILEQRNAR